ncbi:glutamate receptor ionotropic, delta-1-like [Tachypleus tridentatus]|uniref:glutamate receptor ionotropic, delta-1-like n=1 Tax=Tachypleus tridentatus TaxID=6853 RepID=UPI003FD1E3A3
MSGYMIPGLLIMVTFVCCVHSVTRESSHPRLSTVNNHFTYKSSTVNIHSRYQNSMFLAEFVVNLAQLLLIRHVTLLFPRNINTEANGYDTVTSGLHNTGVTTTLYASEDVPNLTESMLRSQLLPYEGPTGYVSSKSFVFLFLESNKEQSLLQSLFNIPCFQNLRWVLLMLNYNQTETFPLTDLNIPCLCLMTIIQRDKKDIQLKYNIYGVPKTNYQCTELDLIENWTPEKSFSSMLSPFLEDKNLSDFKQEFLVVSIVNFFPSFLLEVQSNGSLTPKYGLEVGLLDTLAKKLNFRYIIKSPKDNEWGAKLSNKSWTGMIGMVHRKEADIAIDSIVVTEERQEAVDFTLPYVYDSVRFVTSAPKVKDRALAIIKPFSWQVWLGVFLSVFMATSVITFTSIIMNTQIRSTQWANTLWYVMGCLVSQGGKISLYNSYSVRLFLAIWWFFAVIFSASYGGTLMSHMTIFTKEQPIDTVYTLKTEIQKGQYSCGVLKGAFLQQRLMDSNDPVYGVLGKPARSDFSNVVENDDLGLLRALKSNYAYISAYHWTQFLTINMGEERFHFAKDSLETAALAIPLQKGCPYKKSFNKLIVRIIESGLIQKWTEEVKENLRRNVTIHTSDDTVRSLELDDLLSAFYCLIIGHSLSIVLLGAELVYWKFMSRK